MYALSLTQQDICFGHNGHHEAIPKNNFNNSIAFKHDNKYIYLVNKTNLLHNFLSIFIPFL
jgi:hypothetical protein